MIARLADALPLAASVQDDTHNANSGRNMVDYQNQAKSLFRKMTSTSPARGSVESGPYVFQWVFSRKITRLNFQIFFFFKSYLIDKDVCYLTMCDKQFSKRTAFSYLDDLAQEFYIEFGSKIHTVARPYSFIEFGN